MTLNPQQQAAVESRAALKVVIAGPGSGKTRTMVEAVKRVAKSNIEGGPNVIPIAVMTFTNAGANEFRSRLGDVKLAHCGTLHSYCFKLIQRFGGLLGYIPGKVGILPDAERIPRLLACRDKLGIKISQKTLMAVAADRDSWHTARQPLVWQEYEFLLKRNNLVDYDGILRVALNLLQDRGIRLQVKLDYLFVDEFQDSALIDQRIYEAIPAENKMYVGDGDQSIFAFRGANPMGFVHLASSVFDNSLTDAEGFKLELNYRSDIRICEVANNLIAHNKERVAKVIIPTSDPKYANGNLHRGTVEVYDYETVAEELARLGGQINMNLAVKDMTQAVLYRMNHDVKQCRDYLAAMGIPVQVPKFEQRPADWERAMLLIGLAISPTEILIERYITLQIGAKEAARLKLESTANGGEFIGCAKIKMPIDWTERDPRSAYLYLSMNGVGEATLRLMRAFTKDMPPDATLSDLLHDLHTAEEPKASNEAGGVYVGTIHSAKGREWDVVFLPAFEQGILPSLQAVKMDFIKELPDEALGVNKRPTESHIEEERRLAFVAVTRARHELYISHCAHRRGPWGPVGLGQPSQFLAEMGL